MNDRINNFVKLIEESYNTLKDTKFTNLVPIRTKLQSKLDSLDIDNYVIERLKQNFSKVENRWNNVISEILPNKKKPQCVIFAEYPPDTNIYEPFSEKWDSQLSNYVYADTKKGRETIKKHKKNQIIVMDLIPLTISYKNRDHNKYRWLLDNWADYVKKKLEKIDIKAELNWKSGTKFIFPYKTQADQFFECEKILQTVFLKKEDKESKKVVIWSYSNLGLDDRIEILFKSIQNS